MHAPNIIHKCKQPSPPPTPLPPHARHHSPASFAIFVFRNQQSPFKLATHGAWRPHLSTLPCADKDRRPQLGWGHVEAGEGLRHQVSHISESEFGGHHATG